MARTTKVDVFMPVFIGDYLADTMDLNAEEHGAYLLLLMDLWRRDGRIEFSPGKLARICRVEPERWGAVWESLGRFFEVKDGILTQGRVSHELAVAYAKKEEASRAGKASAAARLLRDGTAQPPNGRSNGTRTDVRTEPQQNGDSSSSPSGSLSGSPSDPSLPPGSGSGRAIPVAQAWAAGDWLKAFGTAWCEKYKRLSYGFAGDGKACGALGDLLSRAPREERARAQANAAAMIAEFLADEGPAVVKASHPFAFFVTAFGGLGTNKARGSPAAAKLERTKQVARDWVARREEGRHGTD